MNWLGSLKNNSRGSKKRRRVGRGPSSGHGKTSGRGVKGAGSRSGYTRRLSYEGGQVRLFEKMPTRGFSRARFRRPLHTINLYQIELLFEEGETVSIDSLLQKNFFSGDIYGLKILGEGTLSKKVEIEANAFSKSATQKLEEQGITFKVVS